MANDSAEARNLRMLIAGGGTGGHLFPGVALAEELTRRGAGHRVLFVGTRRGIEFREVPRAGFDLELIEVGGLKGQGLLGWMRGVLRLPRAMWQSRRILRRFRPDVVVGVGGYASGPVLLCAWLMRLPTAIMEQNAIPGLTNRVLGRVARRVFVAFPQAERFFQPRKVRLLGNPVRRAFFSESWPDEDSRDGLRLLIFGGSQGARAINQVAPEALSKLRERFPDLRAVHQTGERECAEVERRYRELGIQAEVLAFIQDMARAYRRADVVVSRAGATTLAEVSLCRKPAVLIPFPHAADNHQAVNARALVAAGAAVLISQDELSADRLAREVGAVLGDDRRRAEMAAAAGRVSRPESAGDICDSCLELARQASRRGKEVADAP